MATLQSGSVYLSVSADSVSKELVRATRGDDPDRLRQIHQAIETGNDLWRSWALANSGDILSVGGTELRFRIPTEKLKDVAELRRRYAESIGSSVSVGFGTKLSEADQALEAAQKTGGDQILMYSPKIADLMQEPEEPIQKAESLKDLIEKTKQRSERMRHLALTTSGSAWKTANGTVVVGMDPHDRSRWRATRLTETGEPNGHSVAPDHESALKIAYGDGADVMGEPVKSMKKGETGDMVALVKADDPGMNKPAAGGGMTAPQEPSPAAAIAPTDEASEHSENEALREQMAVGGDVQNPADDIHGQLGQMATQQAQKDDQEAQQQQVEQDQAAGQDDMRKQVVAILKVFKDRAQELEGLQEQDPELYQSLTGMLQVMIQMSKEYFGAQANEQDAQQVAKSEDLAKALPRNPAENQANMEHDAVLKDKFMTEGSTAATNTVPYHNPVNQAGGEGVNKVRERIAATVSAQQQNPNVRGNIREPAFLGNDLVRRGPGGKPVHVETVEHPSEFEDPQYRKYARENDKNFWREVNDSVNDGVIPQIQGPEGVWSVTRRTTPFQSNLAQVWLHSPEGAYLENYGTHALHEFWATEPHSELNRLPPHVLEHFRRNIPRESLPEYIRPHAEAWDQLHPGPPPQVPPSTSGADKIPDANEMRSAWSRSPIMGKPKTLRQYARSKVAKAALDAGKTGRHQVNYPVGTQIDGSPSGAHDAGELKVRDPATGKTKWRSVRAGIVMSPDGSPTSSRNPGGSGGGE